MHFGFGNQEVDISGCCNLFNKILYVDKNADVMVYMWHCLHVTDHSSIYVAYMIYVPCANRYGNKKEKGRLIKFTFYLKERNRKIPIIYTCVTKQVNIRLLQQDNNTISNEYCRRQLIDKF